jgi:hypothetical protein
MKKLIICLFLFVGCQTPNSTEVVNSNQATLSSDGEFVGTLKDGRKLIRYRIDRGSILHDHWVYVVEGSISINYTVSRGKNNRLNDTMILID